MRSTRAWLSWRAKQALPEQLRARTRGLGVERLPSLGSRFAALTPASAGLERKHLSLVENFILERLSRPLCSAFLCRGVECSIQK